MTSSTKLPYVATPGVITKILTKIREAKVPDRFTQDFLKVKLGFSGGNYNQFIPLAKKIGFLNIDGTPTDLYKSFRNQESSKIAVATALRQGYSELFARNEYAGNLSTEKLKGLVIEVTGLGKSDIKVKLTCKTFETLKKEADFDLKLSENNAKPAESPSTLNDTDSAQDSKSNFDLRLAYTINLVLPKTDDPAVFNAIFKSLRDNLLRK